MNMVAKMHLRLWETATSSIKKFPASEIEWNTIRPKVQEKRLVYNIKGTHIVYNRAVPLFTCGLKVPGRIDVCVVQTMVQQQYYVRCVVHYFDRSTDLSKYYELAMLQFLDCS